MTAPLRKFVLEQPGTPDYPYQYTDAIVGFKSAGPFYSTHPAEDSEQVWAMVFELPNGGGFLPAWTNGEADESAFSEQPVLTLMDAAKTAESLAAEEAQRQLDDPVDVGE
ncbi:hypothetical protein [Pseudomonas abietaniphila]|uniref:Uncharacterized protein n=1 Tax=Pseudomonas abietaniphila TaxID=89065 RepID=A0A1G8R100_9PSED|nr:hypothetical protein [Pseudomonas abietaniphila]SDJ10080.1 hypothetical protein SAMN05216605_121113 [Pseudomonas abietaniphila]